MTKHFLGIEIGGTKLQLGISAGDGSKFTAFERRDIDISKGATGILAQIEEAGKKLLAAYPVQRIGVGFGGPVDSERGCVIKSHQVAGWDDVPLGSWCEEKFGVPTVLGNDCDCAALAEALFGAGQGSRTVFYVTVGTGIGGGLVIGGRLHGKGRPAVAEIGHLRPGLSADTPVATVESYAAGPAIVDAAERLLESSDDEAAKSELRHCKMESVLTAKILANLAATGNSIAKSAALSIHLRSWLGDCTGDHNHSGRRGRRWWRCVVNWRRAILSASSLRGRPLCIPASCEGVQNSSGGTWRRRRGARRDRVG